MFAARLTTALIQQLQSFFHFDKQKEKREQEEKEEGSVHTEGGGSNFV
jgi:hypothetical protein